MDKELLRRAIIERLEGELAVLVQAANSSRDEATDPDGRQEGKFDMRAQSAAYLAQGQAKLASELAEAIAAYRNLSLASSTGGGSGLVSNGALVTLRAGGTDTFYFVGPARGGMDVEAGEKSVTVITASSPLGRLLVGRRAGEPVGARPDLRIVMVE